MIATKESNKRSAGVNSTSPVSGWRRLLHWSSALLVVVLIAVGKWMADLDLSTPSAIDASIWKFSLHKSVGLIVLILTLIRFASMWLGNGFTPSHHGRLEVVAATAVQAYFLCALILLPLSGLAMHIFSSASAPIWLIPSSWLHAAVARPGLVKLAASFHYLVANGLLIMLILHVAGAVKHHWIDRDTTLTRMLVGHPVDKGGLDQSPDVAASVKLGRLAGVFIVGAIAVFAVFTKPGHDHDHDPADGHEHVGNETEQTAASTSAPSSGVGQWRAIKDASELRIKAIQGSDPFEAEFAAFSVVVNESEAAVPLSLSVIIQSSSFNSGLNDRDQVVAGKQWLDASNFPQATYNTVTIEADTDGGYRGEGMLRIRQIEAPVRVAFSYVTDGEDADEVRVLSGSAEFDRFSIDLGRGDFKAESAAGKMIQVEFDIRLSRSGN